jgi:AraC-like DNA-binding protein
MKPSHRYFPVNDAQKSWGLYATCAGHSKTPPGAAFPSPNHPDEYFFTWDKGRILHEWQLCLIEQGKGVVEFLQRKYTVKNGSFILMPPGCWHRYRPLKSTGWTTLWIGFDGELAARQVRGAGFSSEGEVLDVSHLRRFHKLLSETVTAAIEHGLDNPYTTAARISLLLALLSEEQNSATDETTRSKLVHRAQTYIAEHAAETVEYEQLAGQLGIPYRTFRYIFTRETGSSPHQYQLNIRLARAKNLLRSTDMPIVRIAETLGFNSTWYFAHFFRKRCRESPASYRKKTRIGLY